jgi:sulfur carrier protein
MIRVNGVPEVCTGETVGELLSRRGVDSRGIAVALDGEIIRRAAWAEVMIEDGTVVEIVTAVAGG